MTTTRAKLRRRSLPALAGLVAIGVALAEAADQPAERSDLTAEELARVRDVTRPTADFSSAEPFEEMQAGATTSRKLVNRDAFSHPTANLDFAGQQDFAVGNGLFRKVWVPSPSSTQASDGLGPLFNARSCQLCHLKDGRGRPPASADDDGRSMLFKLSIPPRDAAEREALASGASTVIGDPVYGTQLQEFAVPGVPAEGRMGIAYKEEEVQLAGGETVSLRRPTYTLDRPGYGDPHPELRISPRVAPQMIGLGLVEAIPAEDILAAADPDDADGDGVSGRPSLLRDPATGATRLGRFGLKGGAGSIEEQSAAAFAADIGISTPGNLAHAGDCTNGQPACLNAPSGVQPRLGDSEAPDPILALVTFYSRNLAVPARRDVADPAVLRGKRLFYESGCVSCHTPKFVTAKDAEQPAHRFQLIWPYSDFLLHDMGEGLADNAPAGSASGSEWRTAPLWGIGLTETVNGNAFFLHDGRARSLLEAILWHGGEAAAARDKVAEMTADDRAALIRFLESL